MITSIYSNQYYVLHMNSKIIVSPTFSKNYKKCHEKQRTLEVKQFTYLLLKYGYLSQKGDICILQLFQKKTLIFFPENCNIHAKSSIKKVEFFKIKIRVNVSIFPQEKGYTVALNY